MESEKTVRKYPGGIITPPPSKSLSHRALICAALAAVHGGGASAIENLGQSEDIAATMRSIAGIGAISSRSGSDVIITPADSKGSGTTDCAESGSTLRFMIPVAAALGKSITFTGRGRLMQRPMAAFENVLVAKGVAFEKRDNLISISGGLDSGLFELPGDISSQYISGLLMALPLLDGESVIKLTSPLESSAYVDMTLEVMRSFGVDAEVGDGLFIIPGGQSYKPCRYTVEADFSQAAFFLCAAALGCRVSCDGLNEKSLQGDRAILNILGRMGVKPDISGKLISVSGGKLSAIEVDLREIPDLAPPLATLMCFCGGTSRIYNAGRLRYKESDRLSALRTELGKLGADILEEEDSLIVRGRPYLTGGRADAGGDHRIAMALALASIRCMEPVTVSGADSVSKSYPTFWEDFEKTEWRPEICRTSGEKI